jgi:hypothetical protein
MYFSHMSVLYGAPLRLHLAMLRDVALWTALMLAVPVATTVVAVAVAAIRRRRTSPLEHRQLGALFYALWIAPTALYVTALHCPKPGYLLVALPPAALLLTRAVARASLSPIAACVVAAVVAILGTALGAIRYGDTTLDRGSLASVRVADDMMDAVQREVGAGEDALVVWVGGELYGPNVRSLEMELPGARIWGFGSAEHRRDARGGFERVVVAPAHEVPAEVRRIYWVHYPRIALPRSIALAFPGTHEVLNGRTSRVFRSDVGERGLDAHVTLETSSVHLVRSGSLPTRSCQLAGGFGEGFYVGNPIWGFFPESRIRVRAPAGARVTLDLEILEVASAPQHVVVSVDEKIAAEVDPEPSRKTPIHVDLAPSENAGERVVRLGYTTGREAPPRDAALFGTISCTIDDDRIQLVPEPDGP